MRAQPPQHASGLRDRAHGLGGRRARLRVPVVRMGAGRPREVFLGSGPDWGKCPRGPGWLDPQLRCLTPRFRLVTAGPLRTRFWSQPVRPRRASSVPGSRPRGPGGGWGKGFSPSTSTPPGSLRPLFRSLSPLYMLIVSGKSSLIGRIRQSKRIVSQAEPN